jgi:hypothetical protein
MYPNSLKKLVSYWVPRKSMFKIEENQKMVFFGLQAFIQEYLVEYFNKNFFDVPLDDVLATYRKYLNIQLGEGNYDIDKIVNLHKLGYLPLHISAMPEGTKVNMGVPVSESLIPTIDSLGSFSGLSVSFSQNFGRLVITQLSVICITSSLNFGMGIM